MASFMGTFMGETGGKLNDSVIANDMLAGAKVTAAAYLAASLESATPEIKNLFFNNVTQMVQGHGALADLAIKKGWYKPYQTPADQLKETFSHSQAFVEQNA